MFRKNTVQQLNLDDPTINLPKYLRKTLRKVGLPLLINISFLTSTKNVLKYFIVMKFLDQIHLLMY